jgi:Ca2+-binding EF-hand superfamily protein
MLEKIARDALPVLTEEEVKRCKQSFASFDRDQSGTIDIKELRNAMNNLGQTPSDEELFVMISQVDEDGSKEIDFSEFIMTIRMNKALSMSTSSEQDTIDAFVALGGNADRSGKVLISKLMEVLNDFELRVNLDGLMGEEGKNELEYAEFKVLVH